MSTISYDPQSDELVLEFAPLKGQPSKDLGQFKLWWDEEGNVQGMEITSFSELYREFKK